MVEKIDEPNDARKFVFHTNIKNALLLYLHDDDDGKKYINVHTGCVAFHATSHTNPTHHEPSRCIQAALYFIWWTFGPLTALKSK